MVLVTERAKEELKRILIEHTDSPKVCLRVSHNEQGLLRLSVDEEKPDDETVEHEGVKLLIIEEKLSDLLQGLTIDTQETPEGVKLVVNQES